MSLFNHRRKHRSFPVAHSLQCPYMEAPAFDLSRESGDYAPDPPTLSFTRSPLRLAFIRTTQLLSSRISSFFNCLVGPPSRGRPSQRIYSPPTQRPIKTNVKPSRCEVETGISTQDETKSMATQDHMQGISFEFAVLV